MLYHEIYKQDDSKEWLILLHGLGGNSSIWYKQKEDLINKFNVIFVDLHGHGNSKINVELLKKYTLIDIANDVLSILDKNGIEKAGFMGVSLGTIIARAISLVAPERVQFLVLAGAVLNFNLRSRILFTIGDMVKRTIPYMKLYKLFAWIMMPKDNHKASRRIFIREAVKLGRNEFLFWFGILRQISGLYRKIRAKQLVIPTKYIMGSEDHMFVNTAKKEVELCKKSVIYIIEKSGHLCNIEKAKEFNKVACEYIEEQFLILKTNKPILAER